MLYLYQLVAQDCDPLLKQVDLQLQGEDHLRVPTLTEVLICPLVLLGGGGRGLKLLAFAAQDFLGPAGLDGGEFVIEVALL